MHVKDKIVESTCCFAAPWCMNLGLVTSVLSFLNWGY